MAVAAWLVPALISAIGTGIGLHQSNKARQQGKSLIQLQKENLRTLQPYGKQFLGQGQETLDFVRNYLTSLASGNRALTMQAVAPEINALAQQQLGAVGAQRSLFPRGGTTAAQAGALPQQLQGNISNLLFGVRPQAIQQLGTLGSNMASLGLGAFGQGAGLTNSLLDYGLRSRQQQLEAGQILGQGLSGFGNLLMLYYLNSNRPQNLPVGYYSQSGGYGNLGSGGLLTPGTGTLSGVQTPSSAPYGNYLNTPSKNYGFVSNP